MIYSILTSIMDKLPYIVKWEEDLDDHLQRHKLVQRTSKSLIKTSINKANYKVLLCWYMVPTKLASYVPGASPKCFTGCRQEGTGTTFGGHGRGSGDFASKSIILYIFRPRHLKKVPMPSPTGPTSNRGPKTHQQTDFIHIPGHQGSNC